MPLSTDIDLASTCVPLPTAEELVVQIFGAKLAAQNGYDIGDRSAIVKSMLAQINSSLTPISPFLDVLDVIKSAVDCIFAVKDAIGPPPNPTKLAEKLPKLAEAFNKLLQLFPPVPILILVKGALKVIITGLQGHRDRLASLIAHNARLVHAATRAAQTGNIQLQAVVGCATDNMNAQLNNLNLEMQPLNRLIGVLNTLLQIANFDCIPAIGGVAEISDAALAPLDATILVLTILMNAIPIGIPPLNAITPGECA